MHRDTFVLPRCSHVLYTSEGMCKYCTPAYIYACVRFFVCTRTRMRMHLDVSGSDVIQLNLTLPF